MTVGPAWRPDLNPSRGVLLEKVHSFHTRTLANIADVQLFMISDKAVELASSANSSMQQPLG